MLMSHGKKTLAQRWEPLFYLLPALALVALFIYYPFIKTVADSFFLTDFMGRRKAFVGLENYANILSNAKFVAAIWNTARFVAFTVPLSVGTAFALAMLSSQKRRFSPLYELFFSLPMAMSVSVSAMIFQLMFNPSLGIINKIFNLDIAWLRDKNYIIWIFIIIQVWMNVGYNYLFLLSAIRGIDVDLLEYAELEGVRGFRKAAAIVIPLVSPTLFFLICNSLAKMMMMSGLVLILTEKGPQGNTETMISFMYRATTESQNYNIAYPAAVVAFIITMAAVIITFIYEKKGVHYE
jgi:sn-glycerol 3-phosphate transport system permease protein